MNITKEIFRELEALSVNQIVSHKYETTEYEKVLFKLNFAIQIKEIHTAQQLSQREFAKKIGVSQSTIANIETGNSESNIDTMLDIGRRNKSY